MKLSKHSDSGFTIIELLITVAIVGVLSMIAVPGMGVFIRENRTIAQANAILASLNYARNETISRAVDIRVEPVVAGTTWSGGWLLRIDGNNDNDFADTEDTPIRYFEAVKNATLISSASTITYESEGNLSGTATITLTLTPEVCPTGKEYIRTVTIKPSGHSRVAKSSCP